MRIFLGPLLFFALILNLHAATQSNVGDLKSTLTEKQHEIGVILAQIRSLENNLGKKNNQYLNNLNEFKLVDAKLANLVIELREHEQKYEKRIQSIKDLIHQNQLNSVDSEDVAYLVREKYLEEILTREVAQYKIDTQKIKDQRTEIKEIRLNIEQLRKTDQELHDLIVSLEKKKKNLGETYLGLQKTKDGIEEKLTEAIVLSNAKKKKIVAPTIPTELNLDLILPIKSFSDYTSSKKGVSFKYDKVTGVHAVDGGKVVYSGELASYGNVIMIDHGKNIRSVLLGDMNIRVEKNQMVSKGELIGLTRTEMGIIKSLYFEIRYKNKSQNTANILKKKNII